MERQNPAPCRLDSPRSGSSSPPCGSSIGLPTIVPTKLPDWLASLVAGSLPASTSLTPNESSVLGRRLRFALPPLSL